MKKTLFLLFMTFVLYFPQEVFAENIVPAAVKSTSSAENFAKSYRISSENLLYLLLSAINEHNYFIEEIQFKTGSVLFKAYSKEFIACISSQDGYNSFIKITPVDNVYNFSPVLIQKLHSYIENNNKTSYQKIL